MTYQIVSEKRTKNPGMIMMPEDVFLLLKRYRDAKKEQFIVITLNDSLEPISVSIATIGIVNRTIVHPREIFIRAIQDMATRIIVCHNHPSGTLEPSTEDKEITERLRSAGKILGIHVVDHIIFSKRGFKSLGREGYFKAEEEQ
jgi:DNA repair protein RadC